MEKGLQVAVSVETSGKKLKKKHPFRDTVLVRVDRGVRDAVKDLSKRTKESMSRITDWALEDYLKSVKAED